MKVKNTIILTAMAAAAAFAATAISASANVSLKNGNFFIGYTDLVYNGGMEPKIERVYNSKSSHNGIFGYGWGSDYEVFLKISADGSLIVYENGGGAQNRFTPPNMSTGDVTASVNEIIQAKMKTGLSGQALEVEKKRLTTDARYRNDEWQSLYERKQVKARSLADGTILRSNKFSFQTIKKFKDGYVRNYDNGQVQTFDNDGHLVKWVDKNNNFITFKYDSRGYLASLQDNFNRTIKFTVNAAGKVEKAAADGGKTAEYKYTADELTYSKDTEGNVYQYKYSSNGRHNMVEIKYTDNTTLQLGFFDLNKCENVKWVKDRDNSVTQYDYTGDCNGGLEHSTKTVAKGSDGKLISEAAYTYVEKVKADGERYTYKLGSEVDGDKTETVYSESNLPIEITKNDKKTKFEYDSMGHVIRKETPYDITTLTYDKRVNKVAKVVKQSKTDKTKSGSNWSEYGYDDKANLITAKNSMGKSVRLVYDHVGRIKGMVDQDKRRLEFSYNEANRPVEIKDPALGSIKVDYASSGEIKKVDSTGGRKIASQVTSAFQNLLDIIRPAGVSLSF